MIDVKDAISSLKAIEEQLSRQKIKRDRDVTELYLSKKNLQKVVNLSQFKNLRSLWLNENKLHQVDCLHHNLRLHELYLNDNCLMHITGALRHLTSLHTLFLHNNQLEDLATVVQELVTLRNLRNLNMFHNPVAQEPGYRNHIIFHIPTLTLLDRQEVLDSEREVSRDLYDQEGMRVRESVAFGRRSAGPPGLFTGPQLTITELPEHEVGNNFYRDNPPFENEVEACNARTLQRSVMQFSSMNWDKVPRALERRMANKPFDSPQIITKRFR